MALALDATSVLGAVQVSGTTMTWSHTCSGSNRVLVVLVGMVSTTSVPTGVTYNGVTMKRVTEILDQGGGALRNYIYVLVAPATGTHNIVVTVSNTLGTDFGAASAISFTGAHQTYPYRLPFPVLSGTTPGVTITDSVLDALTGDYIVGSVTGDASTITQDGSQTAINTWNGWNVSNTMSWATAYIPASTRNSLVWTQASSFYSAAAVAIRPDTDTPTVPVLDAYASNAGGSNISSSTISSYVMGSGVNSILIYRASYWTQNANNISSVVFNGTESFTKLDSNRIISATNNFVTEIWYLKNPTATIADIVATFSGVIPEYISGADSWFLVNQDTPFGTVAKAGSASAGSHTVTVSSQAGAVVIDILRADGADYGNQFPTGSLAWSFFNAVNQTLGLSQRKNGAASVTMDYTGATSISWSIMGVGLNFGAPGLDSVIESLQYQARIG